MIGKLKYKGTNLSTWMIAISLFFSSITFSSYIETKDAPPQDVIQTELVLGGKNTPKHSISYKRASILVFAWHCASSFSKDFSKALFEYNRSHKIILNNTINECLAFQKTKQFIQLKTIPFQIIILVYICHQTI